MSDNLCEFYVKNGACRYGYKCKNEHKEPKISRTLLFAHFFENSPVSIALAGGQHVPDNKIQEVVAHLEQWYIEVFLEIAKFGEIQEMHILDNIGDHLLGNVFVKFVSEQDALKVKQGISRRRYRGHLVLPEFSPVMDFEKGSCQKFKTGSCRRGGNCNFLHIKYIRKSLLRSLFKKMYKDHPEYYQKYREKKEKRRALKRERKIKKQKQAQEREEREKQSKHIDNEVKEIQV